MTKRRGRGEGGIRFREDKQLWCASLSDGYDANGKRQRRDVYGKTKREVQEKLLKLQGDALTGNLAKPDQTTVASFLGRWLDDVVKTTARPTTHVRYESVVRNHISRRIGGVKLQKLTPVQVQAMLTAMVNGDVGDRTRLHAYLILHRALQQALKWGIVQRNVCDAVEKPKTKAKAMKVLTKDDVGRLLEAAKADRLHALYLLAVTTGLRQGELFGLQWTDIDLKRGVLSVQRGLSEARGTIHVSEPKTAAGKRRVDLPDMTVAALREHHKRQMQERSSWMLKRHDAEAPADKDRWAWVFCSPEGQPLRKSNFLRRSFYPLLKRSGVPTIRFHDLRHTAATLLLSQGVHPKVVQERLGHSQISLTLDTYSHVLPSMQQEAAAKLHNLLSDFA